MDRRMFDTALPMVYGLIVVLVAMTTDGAVGIVAVVGAMLLGVYWAAIRPAMIRKERSARP